MALSNILREPRREITESLVGITIGGVVIGADYAFGRWLQDYADYHADDWAIFPWPFGMALGVAIVFGMVFVLFVTHALGTVVCDAMEKRGFHLRPRQRPAK